jgi:hypothetical protein
MKITGRKVFREDDFLDQKEELKKLYGKGKKFARGYELPALIALAGYPELKEIQIEFVFANSNTPCSSKPRGLDVFKDPADRLYYINITKQIKKGREEILPKNLPLNMMVGLLAHELAHIVDYLGKGSLNTIITGVLYPLPPYKEKLEKKIDTITVQRGFGHQLKDFAELIVKLQKQYPDDKYYHSYFRYYLSPGDIEKKLNSLKIYS